MADAYDQLLCMPVRKKAGIRVGLFSMAKVAFIRLSGAVRVVSAGGFVAYIDKKADRASTMREEIPL